MRRFGAAAPNLRETKLLAVMYGVMLDDIADQGGGEEFLGELSKIVAGVKGWDFSRFSSHQCRMLASRRVSGRRSRSV